MKDKIERPALTGLAVHKIGCSTLTDLVAHETGRRALARRAVITDGRTEGAV